jgi:hypothetical protein
LPAEPGYGSITTEGGKQLTQAEQYGRNYTARASRFGAQKQAAIVSGAENFVVLRLRDIHG